MTEDYCRTTCYAPKSLVESAKQTGVNLSEVFRLALESYVAIKNSQKQVLKDELNTLHAERKKIDARIDLIAFELDKITAGEETAAVEEQRQAWLSANMDVLHAYRDGTIGPKGWEKLEAGLGISGIKKISEYLDKQKT